MPAYDPGFPSKPARSPLDPIAPDPRAAFAAALDCLRRREFEPAIELFDRVLAAAPDAVDVLNLRGHALHCLQRYTEALQDYDRASVLQPELAITQHQRGLALIELGRLQAALAAFDLALQRAPDLAEAHQGRGIVLTRLRRPEEAAAAYERCIASGHDLPHVRGLALHTYLQQADWSRAQELTAAVLAANARGEPADEPFSFLCLTDSAEAQLRCARTYIADHYPQRQRPVWDGRVYRHDKIRIGYLSADFGDHPVTYLMAGVIGKHARQRFEITGLSLSSAEPRGAGQRIRAAFDRYMSLGSRTDAEIAGLIREQEIDVLVDLMGFTRGARLGVMAHRCAPVQVSYIGYPGSMGAPYFDYLIADRFVILPEQRAHYAEAIAYLPECFQANDSGRPLPHPITRAAAGLPEEGFVFCCFNASHKITSRIFAIWCRLLTRLPNSVLWLLGEGESTRNNLRLEARGHGVAPKRLVFAERVDYESHLARLQAADLFLDTSPFNAGASASDALWCGVPVLTCPGEAFAARMAGSLLRAVGLPELICPDFEQYAHLALELAGNRSRLDSLRERLRANRASSPLFDTARFCRHLERAYAEMQRRVQHGEKPLDITVEA